MKQFVLLIALTLLVGICIGAVVGARIEYYAMTFGG